MKRIALMVIAFLMLGSLVFGASIPLKFQWDPNTDDVTIGYKFYRIDGTRQVLGTIVGKNPTFPYVVNLVVPDGSTGTASFVVTAYSLTKESGDSNVVSYPFDLTPAPAVPGTLRRVP
jgi:hypothetical protein